jgi:hypothetical protein
VTELVVEMLQVPHVSGLSPHATSLVHDAWNGSAADPPFALDNIQTLMQFTNDSGSGIIAFVLRLPNRGGMEATSELPGTQNQTFAVDICAEI